MTDLIEAVSQDITNAIENDQLVLPTLPEVALRVREVAEDSESSVNNLTRVISSDAAISARIIKVCNSPLLRAAQPVENLQMAINRLGMGYTADLATGLAMSQMFQATSDMVDARMRDVWDRSTEVAGLCHVLAQKSSRISAAQAALAGLTHKIGVLPILSFAEDHNEILNDAEALDEIIERLHCEIGEKILRAWDFSEDLCLVPAQYLDFSRDSEQVDLVDIVQVANIQSYSGTNHKLATLEWDTIPAFSKLGVEQSTDEEEEEDLSANMQAALALLS